MARGGWAWRKKRARILKASDICWLCGQPGADSVDHVIAVSKGGTDDDSNLRPAHMHPCNRGKSSKDIAPGITKRSGSLR